MSKLTVLCGGLFAVALAMVLPVLSANAATTPPPRQWVGEFRLDGQAVPLVLHDRSATPGAPSVVDLPTMGAREVALTRFDARGGRVH
ncbi:MAG: hypothetical protein EOP93_15210, partial [Lysobacteraceae bacterium]